MKKPLHFLLVLAASTFQGAVFGAIGGALTFLTSVIIQSIILSSELYLSKNISYITIAAAVGMLWGAANGLATALIMYFFYKSKRYRDIMDVFCFVATLAQTGLAVVLITPKSMGVEPLAAYGAVLAVSLYAIWTNRKMMDWYERVRFDRIARNKLAMAQGQPS